MRTGHARRCAGELRGLLEQEVLDRALLQHLADEILSALKDPYADQQQLLRQAVGALRRIEEANVLQAREVLERLGASGCDEATRWLTVSALAKDPIVERALDLLDGVRSSVAVAPPRAVARARP